MSIKRNKDFKLPGFGKQYNKKGPFINTELGYDTRYGGMKAGLYYGKNFRDKDLADHSVSGGVYGTKFGLGVAGRWDYQNPQGSLYRSKPYYASGQTNVGFDKARGMYVDGRVGYDFKLIDNKKTKAVIGPRGGAYLNVPMKNTEIKNNPNFTGADFKQGSNPLKSEFDMGSIVYGLEGKFQRDTDLGRFKVSAGVYADPVKGKRKEEQAILDNNINTTYTTNAGVQVTVPTNTAQLKFAPEAYITGSWSPNLKTKSQRKLTKKIAEDKKEKERSKPRIGFKQGGQVLELTDAQIKAYKKGGYVVEEYKDGGDLDDGIPLNKIKKYEEYRTKKLIDLSLSDGEAIDKYMSVNPELFEAYLYFKNNKYKAATDNGSGCSAGTCSFNERSWNNYVRPPQTPPSPINILIPSFTEIKTPISASKSKPKYRDPKIVAKQKELIDAGYDIGPTGADGDWGKKSQAAWDEMNTPVKEKSVEKPIKQEQVPTAPVEQRPTGLTKQVPKTQWKQLPNGTWYQDTKAGQNATVKSTGTDVGGRQLKLGGTTEDPPPRRILPTRYISDPIEFKAADEAYNDSMVKFNDSNKNKLTWQNYGVAGGTGPYWRKVTEEPLPEGYYITGQTNQPIGRKVTQATFPRGITPAWGTQPRKKVGKEYYKRTTDIYAQPVQPIEFKALDDVKDQPPVDKKSSSYAPGSKQVQNNEQSTGLTRQVPKTEQVWSYPLQRYVTVTRAGQNATVESTGTDVGGRQLKKGGVVMELTEKQIAEYRKKGLEVIMFK